MTRPVLFVLAGVNGAGKSSVGGFLLRKRGLEWFNPDSRTRELVDAGLPEAEANSMAWRQGVAYLDKAIATRTSFAFETTLGGTTVAEKIREAAQTHDVHVWYCSLASAEMHVERVRQRVAAGGHDIPVERIYERWKRAPANLISLLPHLTDLLVLDNSAPPGPDGQVQPVVVLQVIDRRLHTPRPGDLDALEQVPDWAKAIVQAAFDHWAVDEPTPSLGP